MKLQHPFWSLGFRPFFFFGSCSAILLIVLWLAFLLGYWIYLPYHNMLLWHAHEMLFGFTGAILVGFLLTASQKWSKLPGVEGRKLQGLTLLWLAGRLVPFSGLSTIFIALIDLSFIPLSILLLIPQLGIPEQKHNRVFLYFLGLLSIANFLTQLSLTEYTYEFASLGIRIGTATVVGTIILITGRIIPYFNRRLVKETKVIKSPEFERIVLYISGIYFLVYVFVPEDRMLSFLAIIMFFTHFMRWLKWHPEQTLHYPILFNLYCGYFWIIVALFLQGLNTMLSIPSTLIFHTWMSGGIGVIIYGMITRVSLGHSGRPLIVSKRIIWGYVLINLTVVFRTILPLCFSQLQHTLIIISGLLWTLSYLLLLWDFIPVFMQPKILRKKA